jgi:hypothetical protein
MALFAYGVCRNPEVVPYLFFAFGYRLLTKSCTVAKLKPVVKNSDLNQESR